MTGSVGGFIDKDRPEEEAARAPWLASRVRPESMVRTGGDDRTRRRPVPARVALEGRPPVVVSASRRLPPRAPADRLTGSAFRAAPDGQQRQAEQHRAGQA